MRTDGVNDDRNSREEKDQLHEKRQDKGWCQGTDPIVIYPFEECWAIQLGT